MGQSRNQRNQKEHGSKQKKAVYMREVYSNIGLHQESRKISDKQPNLTPKGARKRTTNKTQSQQNEI